MRKLNFPLFGFEEKRKENNNWTKKMEEKKVRRNISIYCFFFEISLVSKLETEHRRRKITILSFFLCSLPEFQTHS